MRWPALITYASLCALSCHAAPQRHLAQWSAREAAQADAPAALARRHIPAISTHASAHADMWDKPHRVQAVTIAARRAKKLDLLNQLRALQAHMGY